MASLIKIEGIGEKYATKLKMIGISTTGTLLDRGHTPSRKERNC